MNIDRGDAALRRLQRRLLISSLCVCSACGGGSAPVAGAPAAAATPPAVASSSLPAANSGTPAASPAVAPPPAAASASAAAGAASPPASAPVAAAPSGSTVPAMGSTPMASAAAGSSGMATAGSSASPPAKPGADGFPRDEPVNVEQKGPHSFEKYTDGLDNPTYASSVMYYPTDVTPPFAAVVFSPGFTATKEQYEMYLGPLLASHGIAILLTTPTTTGDFPQQRAEDLEAAVMQIAKENTREGSPLKGKLAPDRVCVTGHSMGGGGTLWAASDLGNKIRCAVPLQPWQPGQSFSKISAPTMFIAAESDTVAGVAQNAAVFYMSIPDTVPKYYVEFAGASHFLTTNDLGTAYDVQSKYMIAFYKTYLEGDERYRETLDAPMDKALSKYEHSKM